MGDFGFQFAKTWDDLSRALFIFRKQPPMLKTSYANHRSHFVSHIQDHLTSNCVRIYVLTTAYLITPKSRYYIAFLSHWTTGKTRSSIFSKNKTRNVFLQIKSLVGYSAVRAQFCHIYSGKHLAGSNKLNDTDNLLSGANREGKSSNNHAEVRTKDYVGDRMRKRDWRSKSGSMLTLTCPGKISGE